MNRELAKAIEAALESAQREHNPSADDRARVHAALQRALSAPAAAALDTSTTDASPLASNTGLSAAGGGVGLLKLPLLGLLLALTGAGLWALRASPASHVEGPAAPQAKVTTAESAAQGVLSPTPMNALPQPALALDAPTPPDRPALASNAPSARLATAPQTVRDVASLSPSRRSNERTARRDTASQQPAVAPSPAPVSSSQQPAQASAARASSWPEEFALMRRALDALNAGSAASALVILDEHAARHPRGALRAERLGLRVLALCDAGRTAEGQRERADFLGEFGDLPIARRVRAACAGGGR